MSRSFRQVKDPGDPSFVWVETEIPNGGMPADHYRDDAALERLERFARNFTTSYERAAAATPPSLKALPSCTIEDLYTDDSLTPAGAAGYEFKQVPDGKSVRLRWRLPARPDLVVPKEWFGQRAVDRLYAFLRNWITARDASRSPFRIVELLLAKPNSKTEIIARGWRFLFDSSRLDRFRFEAQLHRRNYSAEQDWQLLGQVAVAIGAPPDPLVPIEKLAPTAPIVWEWTTSTGDAS